LCYTVINGNQRRHKKNPDLVQNPPTVEKRDVTKVKIIYYVIGAIFFMAIGAFGNSFLQRQIANKQIAINPLKEECPTSKTPVDSIAPPKSELNITLSGQEKIYKNDTFGISLRFPKDWFGPEVYEYEDSFIFSVGTDTVYPYGTDRMDRTYTKENSYYISFQYDKKPDNRTIEQYKSEQPWLEEGLSILSLKDGESKSNARNLVTRVKSAKIGNYTGVEFISTLSETAQTEMFWEREVFLIDDNYNTIKISGGPSNVTIQDTEIWKTYYQAVDKENLNSFYDFVNSVSLQEN